MGVLKQNGAGDFTGVRNLGVRVFLACVVLTPVLSTAVVPTARAGECESPLGSLFGLEEVDDDNLGIYERFSEDYEKARELGVRILTVPRSRRISLNNGADEMIPRTFFVYWLPVGFEVMGEKRIMVMLHGANGNAYQQILTMHEIADKEGFAVVAVQWGLPRDDGGKFRYMSPRDVYDVISKALVYMLDVYEVDKNKCAWCGFSAAASQCAVYAFLDRQSGNGFFQLFVAASGQIMPEQRLMQHLIDGTKGSLPLEGTHYYLWAGKRDRRRAEAIEETKDIIEGLGGTVDVLRIGPEGYLGFYQNDEYKLEAVRVWKELDASE